VVKRVLLQYFLGEEVKIPTLCELLLNPLENPALFVTAGGSKNGKTAGGGPSSSIALYTNGSRNGA